MIKNKDGNKLLSSKKGRKMNLIITRCSSFRCQMLLLLQLLPSALCSVLFSEGREKGGGDDIYQNRMQLPEPNVSRPSLWNDNVVRWTSLYQCFSFFTSSLSVFSDGRYPCCLTANKEYGVVVDRYPTPTVSTVAYFGNEAK